MNFSQDYICGIGGTNMHRILTIGMAAVVLMSSTLSLRAATVYTVDVITTPSNPSASYPSAKGRLFGTITTNGAVNINPFTDIESWDLTFTYVNDPNYVGANSTFNFNSTNSIVAPADAFPGLGTTASLASCGSLLCILSGRLSFEAFFYLTISAGGVSAIAPLAGLWVAGAQTTYDPSVDGYALMSTPVPAALPLFASGMGLIGAVTWRRKRRGSISRPTRGRPRYVIGSVFAPMA
jgi:hypothetical protein